MPGLTIGALRPRTTDEEVVRLDIAVDEILLMNRLYPGELMSMRVRMGKGQGQHVNTHHLLRCHTNGLGGKPPAAHIEQVLQAWAKQVNNEDIM